MRKNCLLLLLLALISLSVLGQRKPDPNFHLYLLMGQSNMAGRGLIEGEFVTEGDPRVFTLTKANEWTHAKHPLHWEKPNPNGSAVGPGLAFGISMAKDAKKNVKIGLVPCAVGGSSIEEWDPGAYKAVNNTHPYDDAIVRINIAKKAGIIKGIIWHQGEANSTPERSPGYLEKLKIFVERIRNAVGDPNLPFILGEIGRDGFRESYKIINAELQKVPGMIHNTALASSEGLVHKGDSVHFDSPSAQKFGMRYAEKMKEVQSQLKSKK